MPLCPYQADEQCRGKKPPGRPQRLGGQSRPASLFEPAPEQGQGCEDPQRVGRQSRCGPVPEPCPITDSSTPTGSATARAARPMGGVGARGRHGSTRRRRRRGPRRRAQRSGPQALGKSRPRPTAAALARAARCAPSRQTAGLCRRTPGRHGGEYCLRRSHRWARCLVRLRAWQACIGLRLSAQPWREPSSARKARSTQARQNAGRPRRGSVCRA
jgi:hypothetical protein